MSGLSSCYQSILGVMTTATTRGGDLPRSWAAVAVVVALVVDWLMGEPPYRVHPVVWMGYYLGFTGNRIAPTKAEAGGVLETRKGARFVCGALAWCFGAFAVVMIAAALQYAALSSAAFLPTWLGVVAVGMMLKPLFAWRMLADEVHKVEEALQVSLDEGRKRLSHLVSRDPSKLDQYEVREAAIESLSENFNDSVLAPLLLFSLFGLPGAALYRYANTADSMWGYPGKFAARVDDVLSWPTARMAAMAFLFDRPDLWPRLPPQASLTSSPNAGWPMAAMALYLGVRLGKPQAYVLNQGGVRPTTMSTRRALTRAALVVWVMTALAVAYAAWGSTQGATGDGGQVAGR